ncbi:MAG: hypothetical protein V4574_00065 [Pseudomonadota bacterium]
MFMLMPVTASSCSPITAPGAPLAASAPIRRPFANSGTAPPSSSIEGVIRGHIALSVFARSFARELGLANSSAAIALRIATKLWVPSELSALSISRALPVESTTATLTR